MKRPLALLALAALLVAGMSGLSFADSEMAGPFGPGAAASSGTGAAWINPGNVRLLDATYATVALASKATSKVLNTSDFGFEIPSGATIEGIEVVISRKAPSPRIQDARVALRSGSLVSDNYAVMGTDWPSSQGTWTYGGSDDLWGTTWTAEKINDASFGLDLQVFNDHPVQDRTAEVDHVNITVYYTKAVETPLSVTIDATVDEGMWTNGLVEVTVAATPSVDETLTAAAYKLSRTFDGDETSATVEFFSGEATQSVEATFTVADEGWWTVTAGAAQADDTSATAGPYAFGIDTSGPVVDFDAGDYMGGSWSAMGVDVNVCATDTLSGLASMSYIVLPSASEEPTSGSAWEIATSACVVVPLEDEGEWTIYVSAEDALGNTSSKNFDVKIDKTDPDSTAVFDPAVAGGEADWYVVVPAITIEATDMLSGVDYVEWKLNDGDWTEGDTATGIVDGEHTLYFRAVDVAGNVEATNTVEFKVDTDAPAVDFDAGDYVAGSWTNMAVDVSVGATETLSGFVSMSYIVLPAASDEPTVGAAWETTTTACVDVSLGDEGQWMLYVLAEDVAGNVADETLAVNIDMTSPDSSAIFNPAVADGDDGWYATIPAITISATDDASGVDYVEWKLNDGDWTEGANVAGIVRGEHTLRFRAVDVAGNVEATNTVEFKIAAVADVDDEVISVVGIDRYLTAIEASKLAYPDGADVVIIATGENWPDALGGNALAGALDAPILLTRSGSVPKAVLTEIGRLKASKVIILGEVGAVSAEVAAKLDTLDGVTVERIGGADRYQTANKVALRVIAELEAADGYDGIAFVATGGDFPDSLTAGPIAAAQKWPIFLAHPSSGLSKATKDAMEDVTVATILGGKQAVSAETKKYLDTELGADNVRRLKGDDRYETAVAVAKFAVENGHVWNRVGIATGEDFPDALAGGVLQGKRGSVMLLTRPNSLRSVTAASISANKADIQTVTFFGGPEAIGPAVRASVGNLLQ